MTFSYFRHSGCQSILSTISNQAKLYWERGMPHISNSIIVDKIQWKYCTFSSLGCFIPKEGFRPRRFSQDTFKIIFLLIYTLLNRDYLVPVVTQVLVILTGLGDKPIHYHTIAPNDQNNKVFIPTEFIENNPSTNLNNYRPERLEYNKSFHSNCTIGDNPSTNLNNYRPEQSEYNRSFHSNCIIGDTPRPT